MKLLVALPKKTVMRVHVCGYTHTHTQNKAKLGPTLLHLVQLVLHVICTLSLSRSSARLSLKQWEIQSWSSPGGVLVSGPHHLIGHTMNKLCRIVRHSVHTQPFIASTALFSLSDTHSTTNHKEVSCTFFFASVGEFTYSRYILCQKKRKMVLMQTYEKQVQCHKLCSNAYGFIHISILHD